MNIVTIEEKEYKVCDEWKDVSFGQYIDILNIEKDSWEPLEKNIKIISALSDKPKEFEEALYELDINDLTELSNQMAWTKTEFTEEAENAEIKEVFEIDGKKYCIKKDYKKLTLGEMVSVEEMLKNPNYNHQQIALGVLFRELDENGKEKKFDSDFFYYVVDELMYKINMIDTYKVINFFLSTEKPSTKNTMLGFSVRKI